MTNRKLGMMHGSKEAFLLYVHAFPDGWDDKLVKEAEENYHEIGKLYGFSTLTVTVNQAAQALKVSRAAILVYIGRGDLRGNVREDWVDLESYQPRRVRHYAAMQAVLKNDDKLTDEQRGFVHRPAGVRLPREGLTDRERDVLKRRVGFERLEDIATAHGVTSQRVRMIIEGAVKRLQP